MASAEHLVGLIKRELRDLPENHRDREIIESTLLSLRVRLANRRDHQLRVGSVQDYKEDPHNPEKLTQMWRDIWETWSAGKVTVPLIHQSPFTESSLKGMSGNFPLYIPGGYSDSSAFYNELPEIFPKLDLNAQVQVARKSGVALVGNEMYQNGWMTAENYFSSPNKGFKPEDVDRLTKNIVRQGMTINTYIIASQFSHMTRGWYFDCDSSSPDYDGYSRIGIPTSSYLLGSYYRKSFGEEPQDFYLRASFNNEGELYLSADERLVQAESVGLRTVWMPNS